MARQQLNINIPDDVADYLASVPNKTDTVVKAVRLFMENDQEARIRRMESALTAVCSIMNQRKLIDGAPLESLLAINHFLDPKLPPALGRADRILRGIAEDDPLHGL